MSVTIITTLHEDGYNLYGKDFVSTWAKFFPADWNIIYYAEKHIPALPERISIIDFNNTCPEWYNFYTHVKQLADLLDPKKDKKSINRLKKALRWSFKMFTLKHALENSQSRYIMWLDSDVRADKVPPKNWIENTLENQAIAGQLEHVKGFPHVETGLVLVDCWHPDITKIIDWIDLGYNQKKILDEPKPWDGAWIGKLFESNDVACKKIKILQHDRGDKGSHARAFSDPSLNWLVHKVGDHKFVDGFSGRSGRTADSELI